MTDKRYKTKFAFIGEHADPWANDGPVVWADDILGGLDAALGELERDGVGTPRHPARIVSISEVPLYAKD